MIARMDFWLHLSMFAGVAPAESARLVGARGTAMKRLAAFLLRVGAIAPEVNVVGTF